MPVQEHFQGHLVACERVRPEDGLLYHEIKHVMCPTRVMHFQSLCGGASTYGSCG